MGALFVAERVDDEGGDEEPHGDADGDLDHGDAEGEGAGAGGGVGGAVVVALVLELEEAAGEDVSGGKAARNEVEDAADHAGELGAAVADAPVGAQPAVVDVAEQAHGEGAEGGVELRDAEVQGGEVGDDVAAARDDHHDAQLVEAGLAGERHAHVEERHKQELPHVADVPDVGARRLCDGVLVDPAVQPGAKRQPEPEKQRVDDGVEHPHHPGHNRLALDLQRAPQDHVPGENHREPAQDYRTEAEVSAVCNRPDRPSNEAQQNRRAHLEHRRVERVLRRNNTLEKP